MFMTPGYNVGMNVNCPIKPVKRKPAKQKPMRRKPVKQRPRKPRKG